MGHWHRVSPPEAHQQLAKRNAVVLGGIGLALIGISLSLGRVPQALFLLVFVAVFGVVLAVRARAGVLAGPAGIRLRRWGAVRDLPWSGIADVVVAPARDAGSSPDALWIVTTDGEHVETRVVRHDPSQHGRARGLKLDRAEFDGVVRELRETRERRGSAEPAQ